MSGTFLQLPKLTQAMNIDRGLDPEDLDLFSERPDGSKFIIEDGRKIRIEDSNQGTRSIKQLMSSR